MMIADFQAPLAAIPMLPEATGKLIVSFGGGTNSTAMLIGMAKLGIKPDHILFADTGGEKQGTYHYINYFNNWLYQNGMPLIETVKYKTKFGIELSLEQDIKWVCFS